MTLIAHWPLQENYGDTAYDVSGNSNNGTLQGGVSTNHQGITNTSAYAFDGTDGAVDISTLPHLTSLTFSAWANFNSINDTNHNCIIQCRINNEIQIVEKNGDLSFGGYDSSVTWQEVTASHPGTHIWSHITGTWDGATLKLYINGEQVGSQAFDSMRNPDKSHDSIGANLNADGGYFDGKLADVRVYNRTLTASEIQTLYNSILGGSIQVSK